MCRSPLAVDFQIEHAVARDLVEHVVEKRHAGGELGLAAAVEIERYADLRFVGIAGDLRLPCHDTSAEIVVIV